MAAAACGDDHDEGATGAQPALEWDDFALGRGQKATAAEEDEEEEDDDDDDDDGDQAT